MQLIDIWEAKHFLGIEDTKINSSTQTKKTATDTNSTTTSTGTQTDSTQDLLLKLYIEGISNTIAGVIGRDIMAQDYTEKYEGTNSNSLVLKQRPINNIKSIQYIIDNKTILKLNGSEFNFNKNSGILYKEDTWEKVGNSNLMCNRINFPKRHIKVEYNAGYREAPPELKLLCLEILKQKLEMANRQGLKSYSISDVKSDFITDIKLSDMQLKLLKKFRGCKI